MHSAFKSLLCALLLSGATSTHAVPKDEREFAYVLDRAPDLARGAEIFQACSACHGTRGQGASDGSVPAVAGQHFMVLAKQIVDFRHEGRTDLRMRHFADEMHLALAQQIADVAAYIAAMKPVAEPRAQVVDDVGAKSYAAACASCHGKNGEGQGDWLVPRLAGQHFEYLMRQLEDAKQGARPNMSQSHVERVSRLNDQTVASIARYLTSLPP
jgi:cytochrome c553